jgi:hypothetical protein
MFDIAECRTIGTILCIHFNIVLPFTPRSSEWSLYLRLFYYTSERLSSLRNACYMSCLSYFS